MSNTKQQKTNVTVGVPFRGEELAARYTRLSYVNVFEPKSDLGEVPKFSTQIIIPKTDAKSIKAINDAIETAKATGTEKFGKRWTNPQTWFHDGDVKYPGNPIYAGSMVLTAKSKVQPKVVDLDKNEVIDKDTCYSGCYGRAAISLYPFDISGSKGVAASLQFVQTFAFGPPLGGRITIDEAFSDDEEGWE